MNSLIVNIAVVVAILFGAYFVAEPKIDNYVDERVKAYVNENPEWIATTAGQGMHLLKNAEKVAKTQFIKTLQSELESDDSDPTVGSSDADVKVVLFSDYNCGYCRKVHSGLESLLAADDSLQVVVKEYPVLGRMSQMAALAGLVVNSVSPDKYVVFQSKLYGTRVSTQDELLSITASLGIENEKMMAEFANPRYAKKLQNNLALGERLQVNGTPAFVIGGELYPGALSVEQLQQIIYQVRNNKTEKSVKS